MLRQAHKYIFVARVVAGAMLVSGCRPAAGAAADASSDAKRDGPRLVLPPDSPQIASLAITAATTESTSSITLNGRLVWNEDATVRVFSPFAGRVERVLADGRRDHAAIRWRHRRAGLRTGAGRRATGAATLAERNSRASGNCLSTVVAQKEVETAEADVSRAAPSSARLGALATYGGGLASIRSSSASADRREVVERT